MPSTTVSLTDTVVMPVAPGVAWRHLHDIEAVAACIPGLVPGSVEQVGVDSFRGSLRHLALGIPSLWRLTARVEISEPDRTLTIHLDGTEERLDLALVGDARLSIGSGEATCAALAYSGDLTVTGRLAGAGGPIIERVVASIIERFVEAVGGAGVVPVKIGWRARLMARLRSLFHGVARLDRHSGRT